ncbi:hypothetical protein HUJ05_001642, partial [Dendroctonus ponderosae]
MKRKNKIIKRKIRETKETEVRNMCTEIETLQANHDSFNVHKKTAWRKYILQLFNDKRPELADTIGPHILFDEVDAAIKSLKEGRSPGPDNINA